MKTLAAIACLLLSITPSANAAVVVELFTSQGCSSCPPADELLHELASDPGIIAIAYHVDYWDRLGWRDPFSSRDWTIRQMGYVRSLELPSAYTPQIVVGGTRQMIGSSGAVVRTAIHDAASEKGRGSVTIALAHDVAVVSTNAPVAGLDLVVVSVQESASTKVLRGENEGRTMINDAIARKLVRVQGVVAGEHVYRVPIQGEHIVAMLQDPATLRIYAAARH